MRRIPAAMLATAALSACSTSPVPLGSATPAPPNHVMSNQFTRETANSQAITLVRDSGIYGAVLNSVVWVDGVKTAELGTSEKVTLHIPPGPHLLAVSRKTADGTGPAVPITVPSATTKYRISDGQVLLPIE